MPAVPSRATWCGRRFVPDCLVVFMHVPWRHSSRQLKCFIQKKAARRSSLVIAPVRFKYFRKRGSGCLLVICCFSRVTFTVNSFLKISFYSVIGFLLRTTNIACTFERGRSDKFIAQKIQEKLCAASQRYESGVNVIVAVLLPQSV